MNAVKRGKVGKRIAKLVTGKQKKKKHLINYLDKEFTYMLFT